MSPTSGSQPQGGELLDALLAEALDVHGAAGGEVEDGADGPRRADDVDAEGVGLGFEAHEGLAAHRARRWEAPPLQPLGPLGEDGPDDLGDDVARPPDDDEVAGTDVLRPHLVLVVQGGALDGHAADEHRVEHGERRRSTGAPDGDPGSRAAASCAPRAGT